MEINSSAFTGSLRLALQVVTNHKRPLLEIYSTLRNREGKKQNLPITNSKNEIVGINTHTHHEIFAHFMLVNIGSLRAEKVVLKLEGDFSYMGGHKKLSDIAILKGVEIAQLAPAQSITLCNIKDSAFYEYGEDGKRRGLKKDSFSISIEYNGPNEGLNKIFILLSRLRNKKQYKTIFYFNPLIFDGIDLPPLEYR